MKRALLACLILLAAPARAGDLCPPDPAQAAAQAKAVLAKPQETLMTDRDRVALLCLADAVAAIGAKLEGLSDGSIPFDGQIHIPKGWVITKPPTEEAD